MNEKHGMQGVTDEEQEEIKKYVIDKIGEDKELMDDYKKMYEYATEFYKNPKIQTYTCHAQCYAAAVMLRGGDKDIFRICKAAPG